MANDGYIKLYRKMMKWGWYTDTPTKCVFLHLLFLACYEPCFFRGVHLDQGQAVASIRQISVDTGLSVRSVRTALEHLKTTQEVTHETFGKFSVFTVQNYSDYQGTDTISDKPPTQNRHSTDTDPYIKKLRSKEVEEYIPVQFEAFWTAYPRHQGKEPARKAFAKLKPDQTLLDTMLSAIGKQKQSEQWTKDGGQFIPMASTWLNQRRWEDVEQDAPEDKPVSVPKEWLAQYRAEMQKESESWPEWGKHI